MEKSTALVDCTQDLKAMFSFWQHAWNRIPTVSVYMYYLNIFSLRLQKSPTVTQKSKEKSNHTTENKKKPWRLSLNIWAKNIAYKI